MKNEKQILFGMFVALGSPFSAWSGSGGTTGGGDVYIPIENLMPKIIEVKKSYIDDVSSRNEAYVIGERNYFGIFPGKTYATHLHFDAEYEFERFKKGENDLLLRVKGTMGLKKSAPSFEFAYDSIRSLGESPPLLMTNSEGKTLTLPNDGIMASLSRDPNLDIHYDNEPITREDLLALLKKNVEIAVAQTDLMNFDHVKDLRKISQLIQWLPITRTGTFNRRPQVEILPPNKVVTDLGDKIQVQLQTDVKGFQELTAKVIRYDGVCDREQFEILQARLNSWTLGSKRYSAWMIESFPEFEKTKFPEEALKLRQRFQSHFENNVVPFCSIKSQENTAPTPVPMLLGD